MNIYQILFAAFIGLLLLIIVNLLSLNLDATRRVADALEGAEIETIFE